MIDNNFEVLSIHDYKTDIIFRFEICKKKQFSHQYGITFELLENIGNDFQFSSGTSTYVKLVSDTGFDVQAFAAKCTSKFI